MEGGAVFSQGKIGALELRNRVIRAGCFEGMCQAGNVTEALIEHHRRVAAGGVAMTTVAYCSISFDGRAFGHEMWMREEIVPALRRLTGYCWRTRERKGGYGSFGVSRKTNGTE